MPLILLRDPRKYPPTMQYLFYVWVHHSIMRVQEFCNGGSVRNLLERGGFARVEAADKWKGRMHVLEGIATGMHYMHSRRICHGDLNPSNVLLKVRPFIAAQ